MTWLISNSYDYAAFDIKHNTEITNKYKSISAADIFIEEWFHSNTFQFHSVRTYTYCADYKRFLEQMDFMFEIWFSQFRETLILNLGYLELCTK